MLTACGSDNKDDERTVEDGVAADASATTEESTTTEAGATTTTPADIEPADALASSYLDGNASPVLPVGEPGAVSIVASAPRPPDGPSGFGSIPVVVRNNTDEEVLRVEVAGYAALRPLTRDTCPLGVFLVRGAT